MYGRICCRAGNQDQRQPGDKHQGANGLADGVNLTVRPSGPLIPKFETVDPDYQLLYTDS
jgi:hypothetical protein